MQILYEDNHIIVVIKECNIPVQEDNSKDLDMLTMIKQYIKEKYNKPGNVYLGLVHRLDRPVGGVMVFAKTSKAASRLSEQIRNKSIEKRYIALTHNHTKEHEILKDKLLKNEKTNTSKIDEKGKYAILEYNLIEYRNNMSLIDINLLTGRHHQIRVQLSHAGHSIFGDQKYGTRGQGKQIALWAYELTIQHPITKEEMTFKCFPESNGTWCILRDIEV